MNKTIIIGFCMVLILSSFSYAIISGAEIRGALASNMSLGIYNNTDTTAPVFTKIPDNVTINFGFCGPGELKLTIVEIMLPLYIPPVMTKTIPLIITRRNISSCNIHVEWEWKNNTL